MLVSTGLYTHRIRLIRHVISRAHFIFQLGITGLVVAFIYCVFVLLILYTLYCVCARLCFFLSCQRRAFSMIAIAFYYTTTQHLLSSLPLSLLCSNSVAQAQAQTNIICTPAFKYGVHNKYLVIHRSFIWQ